MNVQSPLKWWSTLKYVVFGSSSSLPPLVCEGGGLVCESVGKAYLRSDHFDSKQSREAVDLPLNCHLSPSQVERGQVNLCLQVERGQVSLVKLGPSLWH